jgi:hypothetical protein
VGGRLSSSPNARLSAHRNRIRAAEAGAGAGAGAGEGCGSVVPIGIDCRQPNPMAAALPSSLVAECQSTLSWERPAPPTICSPASSEDQGPVSTAS